VKKNKIIVQIQRVEGYSGDFPRYASIGAAGVDLQAFLSEPVTIAPMERRLIPTGIAVAIPEGFEGQVRPRSGLALKFGVTLLNTPGTIDSDYRGQIKVIMINLGDQPFEVKPADRIAQLVFAPVSTVLWEESKEIPDTKRGQGGFGHTGI
jgi:dUTP pyrophosphatase